MTTAYLEDRGENSNDYCHVCSCEWTPSQKGWVLCDNPNCENTVCPSCTSALSLSVSELFYCPSCAGSGESAAAAVGGAVATAVKACAALEKLPLSMGALKKILGNLKKFPNEEKYRKLRLENRKVRELVDLEPVLNILMSVGFARKRVERETAQTMSVNKNDSVLLSKMEETLMLEGEVPITEVEELLEILNGLSPEITPRMNNSQKGDNENGGKQQTNTADVDGKRKKTNEDTIHQDDVTTKRVKKTQDDNGN